MPLVRRALALLIVGGITGVSCARLAQAQAVPLRQFMVVPSAAPLDAPVENERVASAMVVGPDGVVVGSAAQGASATDEKSERLQKIRELTLDRRPSAMLKLWSERAAKPAEVAAEDGTAPETGQASPEDAATATAAETAAAETSPTEPAETSQAAEPGGQPIPPSDGHDARDAAQAQADAQARQLRMKQLEERLKEFQRAVTLGNWQQVHDIIRELPEEEGLALHERLMVALAAAVATSESDIATTLNVASPEMQQIIQQVMQRSDQVRMRYQEKNILQVADLMGILRAAPKPLEKEALVKFSRLVQASLAAGNVLEEFLGQLSRQEPPLLTARQTAKVLNTCGRRIEMGVYLPQVEAAISENDREALNLLAAHFLAMHARDKKVTQLEEAWRATQAALAAGELDEDEKKTALERAVELAPRIRESFGEAWLTESFTRYPERGREILATIGAATAGRLAQQPHNADLRQKTLELQKTAIDALLRAAPDLAAAWSESLNLLAINWLQEAQVSYQFASDRSSSGGMQRDRYGNIFFIDDEEGMGTYQSHNPNAPRPIGVLEVLESRPEGAWREAIDAGLRPKFDMVCSQLFLKADRAEEAFPYIERMAAAYPREARDLVGEFLRVWTRNHNPNEARDRTNAYMFIYGYEQKADRIPLTRSKQERNLTELSQWVERLRTLGLGPLDEQLLVNAFTTCHSSAEVYRLSAIQGIFGSLDQLRPKTLAALMERMRGNLASVWRQPDVQQAAGTKRKKPDIALEVARGYQVANAVLQDGLRQFPGEWRLLAAQAALAHDENEFRQDQEKSSTYSAARAEALALFAQAAEAYARAVPDLEENEQSNQLFDQWFYAALGAVDLSRISQESRPDLTQIPCIKEALDRLPGEAAQTHRDRFANSLFTRMSSVNPACKFRYLKAGFDLVGDHPQAGEARQVFDYYQDLVTEIQLDVRLDGSDSVGHEQPFGVFVDVRHTKEIERESGGFSKYLQNQNTMYYAYNYGRPTENYRDKFQEAVTSALEEHFEVLSVTFNHAEAQSRAVEPYGWRVTPYAHLLLQARGPEVDKLPPLQLDLDFLDTSGYVVLPVASAAIPLDASHGETRDYRKAELVQTLDERQAGQGKLLLEIKATAHGLVPPLEQIVPLKAEGFDLVKLDDQGVSVSQFEDEADGTDVLTERLWIATLQASSNSTQPKTFAFPVPGDPEIPVVYQRYDDEDLVEVEPSVSLEQNYAANRNPRMLLAGFAVALLFVGLAVAGLRRVMRQGDRSGPAPAYRLPDRLTPFNVLALLEQVRSSESISREQRARLDACIAELQTHYFHRPQETEPDLEAVAHEWLGVAQP